MQWDEKIVFIQPVVIIIIIVISLCPFPLAYDVCWSFIFSLYVPINNLSQILQILVPGIDNYPVCDIKSVSKVLSESWALFFFTICKELPQASSHFIFKLCSYPRNTSVIDDETTQCREDLSRNLLKVCWHLFVCSPPYLMDHHNVTLVSYFFFINVYLFHYVLSEGAALEDHSVFMPLVSIYELTQ